ncbi:MAG: CBS domain-containing protein [Nitrospinae bacterium]|nr:CBS domain-containing protein [Nitrospinota bacterium]
MLKASDILSDEIYKVNEDSSLKDVFDIFLKDKPHGIFVVDENDRFSGVITESDLIEQQSSLHLPTIVNLFEGVFVFDNPFKLDRQFEKMAGTTAGDICSEEVLTVKPDETLQEIATMMTDKKIHFLPVIDDEKNILGVVTKYEMITAMAKEAGYITK